MVWALPHGGNPCHGNRHVHGGRPIPGSSGGPSAQIFHLQGNIAGPFLHAMASNQPPVGGRRQGLSTPPTCGHDPQGSESIALKLQQDHSTRYGIKTAEGKPQSGAQVRPQCFPRVAWTWLSDPDLLVAPASSACVLMSHHAWTYTAGKLQCPQLCCAYVSVRQLCCAYNLRTY